MLTKVQRVTDLINSGYSAVIVYNTILKFGYLGERRVKFFGIPIVTSHKYNELNKSERLRLNILKQLGMGTSWCTRASKRPCKALKYLSEHDMLVIYRDDQPLTQAYFYNGYGNIKHGSFKDINNQMCYYQIYQKDIPDADPFIRKFFI